MVFGWFFEKSNVLVLFFLSHIVEAVDEAVHTFNMTCCGVYVELF